MTDRQVLGEVRWRWGATLDHRRTVSGASWDPLSVDYARWKLALFLGTMLRNSPKCLFFPAILLLNEEYWVEVSPGFSLRVRERPRVFSLSCHIGGYFSPSSRESLKRYLKRFSGNAVWFLRIDLERATF